METSLFVTLFGLATQISAAFAVRMSVRLSVCHTRESHLNGSRYRNMLCTIRQIDISSFLRPNFAILNLVVHPELVR